MSRPFAPQGRRYDSTAIDERSAPLRAGVHAGTLELVGCEEVERPPGFGPLWRSFRSHTVFEGQFHVMVPNAPWQLSIHDFTLPEDSFMEFRVPEYLSVTYYESIAGEQFTPYLKLRAKSLWGFCSGDGEWRGFIHGGIPVRSVGIEVRPEMAREFLAREYDGQFESVRDAFVSLNDLDAFPELQALLAGLWPHPGDETRSLLYYEGKVLEAMGLIVECTKTRPPAPPRRVSDADRERIVEVMTYIDDHCASTLRIAELAQAACMSPTKFKECFRAVSGSTVTRYVQRRRISQAESLLRQSSLSVEQVAQAVGYSCASRFAELFRRETGMLPSEFREGARRAR